MNTAEPLHRSLFRLSHIDPEVQRNKEMIAYAQGSYVFFLSIDGAADDEVHQWVHRVKKALHEASITCLTDIDQLLEELLVDIPVKSDFSCIVLYASEKTCYIKSTGTGTVYLVRNGQTGKILEGENCASGHMLLHDEFIITTHDVVEALPESLAMMVRDLDGASLSQNLRRALDDYPQKALLVAEFQKDPVPPNIPDAVVADGRFEEQPPNLAVPPSIPAENNSNEARVPLPAKSGSSRFPSITFPSFLRSRKVLTSIGVVCIGAVLLWSVVFGYQRRQDEANREKIQAVQGTVEQLLKQAEDDVFLNPVRSANQIDDAKKAVAALRSELPGYDTEITQISEQIENKEQIILQKEDKQAEDFYDLTVEKQTARGDAISRFESRVAILDSSSSIVYILDLEKKSLETRKTPSATKATHIALYEDRVYLLVPGTGVVDVGEKEERVVIAEDPAWGTIRDMNVYNGNMYLLDGTVPDIYKYVVAENGFGSKSSYFKGTKPSQDYTSFAIDSSIYIADGSTVEKYTAGLRDEFTPVFPQGAMRIDAVIAEADSEMVVIWNKKDATVALLEKTGMYQKSIRSSAFARAEDCILYDNALYTIAGSKISRVSLQ